MLSRRSLKLGILLILLVVVVVFLIFQSRGSNNSQATITSFEKCVAAGNSIMESYPERCRDADGNVFIKDISDQEYIIENVEEDVDTSNTSGVSNPTNNEIPDNTPAPTNPSNSGECYIGGCSGHVCSDVPPGDYATTCEWLEEYACYRETKCERQSSGECGWTQTEEFAQCLESSRNSYD